MRGAISAASAPPRESSAIGEIGEFLRSSPPARGARACGVRETFVFFAFFCGQQSGIAAKERKDLRGTVSLRFNDFQGKFLGSYLETFFSPFLSAHRDGSPYPRMPVCSAWVGRGVPAEPREEKVKWFSSSIQACLARLSQVGSEGRRKANDSGGPEAKVFTTG